MATPAGPDSINVFPSMVEVHGHPVQDGYLPLNISTARGPVEARLFEAPEPLAGVVLVGGVGGGFDQPADGLYDRLGNSLSQEGIAVLRVRFRDPSVLAEAEHDVLAGCRVLLDLGVERLGLVGHSFGGAVVIRAAQWEPEATAVVTLATQSHGAEVVTRLQDRHVLLIHGTDDRILPAACSEDVARLAGDQAEVILLDGAGHDLDSAAPKVLRQVHDWLVRYLSP